MLTGEPSTANVPGRPNRGAAQPGDTTTQSHVTQVSKSPARLTMGTPEHTRIHAGPNAASYCPVLKFFKNIWRDGAAAICLAAVGADK
jgi:hypothetical protein